MSFDITNMRVWVDPADVWTNWYKMDDRLTDACKGDFGMPAGIYSDSFGPGINGIVDLGSQAALECDKFGNAYHNTNHALGMNERVTAALLILEDIYEVVLPAGFLHSIIAANLHHDHSHTGTTFLIDAPSDRVPQDVDPTSTAMEEVSARACDQHLELYAATPAQRKLACYLIWSTSFGGNTEQGRHLGIDKINPSGLLGRLVRAADVTLVADMTTSIDADTAVQYGEQGSTANLTQYITHRRGFFDYVEHCYDLLDEAADPTGKMKLTSLLPWRKQLMLNRSYLRKAEWGDINELITIRAQIAKHQKRRRDAAAKNR